MFTSKKNVYVQGYSGASGLTWGRESLGQELLCVGTHTLQCLPPKCSTYSWKLRIIQNCEDHYDRQWQAVFRNGKYVSEFYETRALKPFDSQMKPKVIWELTDVILLAEELDGGGDGWGIACVLTIGLFVTDWQMDRGVEGRGKRKKKLITGQVEKQGYF